MLTSPFLSKKYFSLLFSISLILVFSCVSIYPQTIIKEKVIVKPNNKSPNASITSVVENLYTINLTVGWDNPNARASVMLFTYNDSVVTTSGWVTSGSISLTAQEPCMNAVYAQIRMDMEEFAVCN